MPFSAATLRKSIWPPPLTAAGLRVYPPNLTTSKVVPFPFSACSLTGPVYLNVRAVKLG